jgi:hypothetical protein
MSPGGAQNCKMPWCRRGLLTSKVPPPNQIVDGHRFFFFVRVEADTVGKGRSGESFTMRSARPPASRPASQVAWRWSR